MAGFEATWQIYLPEVDLQKVQSGWVKGDCACQSDVGIVNFETEKHFLKILFA